MELLLIYGLYLKQLFLLKFGSYTKHPLFFFDRPLSPNNRKTRTADMHTLVKEKENSGGTLSPLWVA
jgi:hypothetical protein